MSKSGSSSLQISVEPLQAPNISAYGVDYDLYLRHYSLYVKACATYQADKNINVVRIRSKRPSLSGFTRKKLVVDTDTDVYQSVAEEPPASPSPPTLDVVAVDTAPSFPSGSADAGEKTLPKHLEALPVVSPPTQQFYDSVEPSTDEIKVFARITARSDLYEKNFPDRATQLRFCIEAGLTPAQVRRAKNCPSFNTLNEHFTGLFVEFLKGSSSKSRRKLWRIQVANWKINASEAGLAVSCI